MWPFAEPDNRSVLLDEFVNAELGWQTEIDAKHDALSTTWLHTSSLLNSPTIRWGYVVDFNAHINAYRISGGTNSFVWCSAMSSSTGFLPAGPKASGVIPIGNIVFYISHPETPWWGTIIGAEPFPILSNHFYRAEIISLGSRVGLKAEPYHRAFADMIDGGGVINFSCGRPLDQTMFDWSIVAETGASVHVDPFMAFLRIDESTGLFVFYHDHLTRLSGRNLQIRSMLRDREELLNRGESSGRDSIATYFWEALGAFSHPLATGVIDRSFTPEAVQTTDLHYGTLEPQFDDQQPFHRWNEWTGYLGQGYHRTLSLPPPSPLSSVNRHSDDNKLPGVFKEQLSLAGAWMIASADRLILRKTPRITVPKPKQRPEDTDADIPSTYRSAGFFGTAGPAHIITDEMINPSPLAPETLVRATAVLDTLAFAANWEGDHPYALHPKEYYMIEEEDIPVLGANFPPPSFVLLGTQQYLDPAAPVSASVDHRYGAAKYYPSEAFQVFHEDGALTICAGEGCSIRMAGGNMFLSAPGDIFLQPGRNLNCWAGWDAIFRAYNSADITANNKDVRVKAQNNVQVLGGNSGVGGVLIESRSAKDCITYDYTNAGEDAISSGIILKSANGQISSLAKDIIIRSSLKEDDPGDIFIDAGVVYPEGTAGGRIVTYSRFLNHFISEAKFDFFIDAAFLPPSAPIPFGFPSGGGSGDSACALEPGEIVCVNEWRCDSTYIGAKVYFHDQVQIATCLWVAGHIMVTDGHIYTHFSTAFSGLTGQLTDGKIAEVDAQLDDFDARICFVRDVVGSSELVWLRTKEAVITAKPEFSLRTPDQYRIEGANFILFENCWQQAARLDSQDLPVWIENFVSTSDPNHTETYPHPGRDAWAGFDPLLPANEYLAWHTQDLTLYDVPNSISINRAINQAAYELPEFGILTRTCLDGSYPIVRGS